MKTTTNTDAAYQSGLFFTKKPVKWQYVALIIAGDIMHARICGKMMQK
jgi:hypothetical protein